MEERKQEKKFNIKKLQKEKEKYWKQHEKKLMELFEVAFQKQQEMEQAVKSVIERTELEIGERKVKPLGNGCYVLIPKKYDKRDVIILLKKEEPKTESIPQKEEGKNEKSRTD